MAINGAWNNRCGPGGSTRRLHHHRRCDFMGGEIGSTRVVKTHLSLGMVPPLSGYITSANDNHEALASRSVSIVTKRGSGGTGQQKPPTQSQVKKARRGLRPRPRQGLCPCTPPGATAPGPRKALRERRAAHLARSRGAFCNPGGGPGGRAPWRTPVGQAWGQSPGLSSWSPDARKSRSTEGDTWIRQTRARARRAARKPAAL